MVENMTKKVFAFDLGSGSLGECVREGDKITYLHSLLLDADFASIKNQRIQRRGYRTRLAHQARERWWQKIAQAVGLEVLATQQPTFDNPTLKPDERMLREFAQPGDETLYTSCLLRMALIQGKPLASWQVYKAVWSALQHRGYDTNLPWKSDIVRIQKKINAGEPLTAREQKIWEDEKQDMSSASLYLKAISAWPEGYRLPCYYEAYKLGLWTPQNPKHFQQKVGAYPLAARNKEGAEMVVAPRNLVEKELLLLLAQAAKQYPALKGKEKFIIYGPAEQPYASVKNREQFGEYRGKEWEWQGVLAQKTPRFDNRALMACRLIPRFHVCKADTPIAQETLFVLNLKNMRFTLGLDTRAALMAEQLKHIYREYVGNLKKTGNNALGKREWAKVVRECGGVVNENQAEVAMPSKSGRCRFSRPALKLLKELILSGKNPHDFYREKIDTLTNVDPKKGLVKEDFNFLLAMPNDWDKIHIADCREEDKALTLAERAEEITAILGNITHPIVRHRLHFLWQELERLQKQYGTPDEVVLEIVRDDFLSDEQKKEFERQQKKNQKINAALAQEYGEKNVLKMRLFQEQNGVDLYDTSENNHLRSTDLDQYDVDHIVPRAQGGADSYVNKVLTKRALNEAKGKKTPYEWLGKDTAIWSAFLSNIKQACRKGGLSDDKIELLTAPDAAELEKSRRDLHATAYLEKLAQRIVALHFGWGLNTKDDNRRIFVATGGQTAYVRRVFHLDRLLHQSSTKEEFRQMIANQELNKKNRANKRHHALDALVLSLIRDIRYNVKDDRLEAPIYFNAPFCDKALRQVYPEEVKTVKPKLRETMYGLRERITNGKKEYFIVTRFNSLVANFQKISDAKKMIPYVFDPDLRQQLETKFKEPGLTEESWKEWLDTWSEHGRKIRKMTKVESGPFTEKDILIKNGRRQIGCFYELGKMKGQFLTNKEQHKGQIVYRDSKGKWCVNPVYLWESLPKKLAEAKKEYGKVLFFRSGQLVEVQENVGKVKKGVYRLRSIQTKGQMTIESLDTQILEHPMIGKMLDEGKMRLFKTSKG